MPNFSIKEVLGDKAPTVTVVDIGAMIEGPNRYDGLVKGGMAQVIGFEPEVEFVPLYKDQPLFAEIDAFMRAKGFMLHKFHEMAGRAMRPFLMNNDPLKAISQVLWANAVYIKDVTRFSALNAGMLLKTA